MSCNCKHNKDIIDPGYKVINELRELFIKRMTVDSETQDVRRSDFNQAIFSWWYDDEEKFSENTFSCVEKMNMQMILEKFDMAVKDWRKTFCDVENCKRK